jgi:lysozyme family protein
MLNAVKVASRSTADSAPARRRIVRVDGRSRVARRIKELVADYTVRLGGNVGPATLAEIMCAAESVVIAEEMRAKALRGEAVDMAELNKANGVAARAVRALGIKSTTSAPTAMSLSEYLAAKGAAAEPEDEPEDEPAAAAVRHPEKRTSGRRK